MRRRIRGEGSITPPGPGRRYFLVQVSAGTDPVTKKRRRLTATAKTPQEARRVLAELREQRDAGVVPTGERLTAVAYLHRHLHDVQKDQLASTSWDRYESILRKWITPALGNVLLVDLTPVHVEAMLAAIKAAGGSTRTRQYAHIFMRKTLAVAEEHKLIRDNPVKRSSKPKHAKAASSVWSVDEAYAFLASCREVEDQQLATMALVIATTGLREGEAAAIWWSVLDLQHGSLDVERTLVKAGLHPVYKPPKTQKSRRRVALAPLVVEALKELRQARIEAGEPVIGDVLVFRGSKGRALQRGVVLSQMQRAMVNAGVRVIRVHDLRHTAATLLIAAGTNPKQVSSRLGHSSVAFTMDTYVKALEAPDRAAAETLEQLIVSRKKGT